MHVFTFHLHHAGRIETTSEPILTRGPYVWHHMPNIFIFIALDHLNLTFIDCVYLNQNVWSFLSISLAFLESISKVFSAWFLKTKPIFDEPQTSGHLTSLRLRSPASVSKSCVVWLLVTDKINFPQWFVFEILQLQLSSATAAVWFTAVVLQSLTFVLCSRATLRWGGLYCWTPSVSWGELFNWRSHESFHWPELSYLYLHYYSNTAVILDTVH